MSESDDSQESKEYEVEVITMARMQGRGKSKQWLYQVKWKGYGNADNTWEPIASFEGSEHFVNAFWSKVNDKRDWRDVSAFEHNETMLPTGPPGRRGRPPKPKAEVASKSQPKEKDNAPTQSASRSTSHAKPKSTARPAPAPGQIHKRKHAELDDVEMENMEGNSESEVQSIIEPEPVSRGRPRRRLEEDVPSESRKPRSTRRATQPSTEEDEVAEKGISSRVRKPSAKSAASGARPPASKARPISTNGSASARATDKPSRGRKAANNSRPSASTRGPGRPPNPRGRPKKATASSEVERESSPDVILLGEKKSVPADERAPSPELGVPQNGQNTDAAHQVEVEVEAMQVDYPDTGAEADVEDEAMQVEQVPDDDVLEVPSSDILEQQMTLGAETEREEQPERVQKAKPPSPEVKLPAHRARAANPRIKLMEDNVKDEGPSAISTKARITRRMSNNHEAGPSSAKPTNSSPPKKRGGPSAKPGPGRSSSGFQLGSTSLLTVVKKGVLQTLSRSRPVNRSSPEVESSPSVLVADGPHEPEPAPTARQLLELGGLKPEDAGELPDFEDADADGDPDIEHHSPQKTQAGESTAPAETPIEGQSEQVAKAEAADVDADAHEARSVEQIMMPDAVENAVVLSPDKEMQGVTPSGVVVNPPDAAIGRSASNPDIAAWKQTTIFGPLGIGREEPKSPTLPDASTSTPTEHTMSIVLTPTTRLSVVLKDVHPASTSEMQRLDEIVMSTNSDPSGRFYGNEDADLLINAFRVEGSSARIVKDPVSDNTQQQDFERFSTRLKTGGLYLATANGHVLAFCSSENTGIATKLGISPDLVGLSDNVLVSEVIIKDEGAYCDAVFNAADGNW
ncbi:hypothetical protein NM688_g5689 [Phlebia brevispora]|uniref:Uncharacterized protein n=1 Tax=Phlebia brevispora TaxID=194682 RepID=A0ACC1SRP7_9APHY|nr:hypothetical protein NM688_g5689 [Phlebia brevispora]